MPRAFWFALLGVNAVLALAAAAYAARAQIPARQAGPIVAAFLLQISFYLAMGFPRVRRRLEERLVPAQLAALAVAAALAPYVVYSVPTGVFAWPAFVKLAAIAGILGFVFVARPTRSPGLSWQDLLALAAVAAAMLFRLLRDIYRSPIEGVRLESMGQIMLIGLGATAFLSLRPLEDVGWHWPISRRDWKTGIRQSIFFLPFGLGAGLALNLARFHPVEVEPWRYPILAAATFAGMYAVVALFEELFFRGILQNLLTRSLGQPAAAQAVASVIFGLCHLPFRVFPNWRLALVASLAGWFYGQAYREGRSIVPAMITHALVATGWRLLFTG